MRDRSNDPPHHEQKLYHILLLYALTGICTKEVIPEAQQVRRTGSRTSSTFCWFSEFSEKRFHCCTGESHQLKSNSDISLKDKNGIMTQSGMLLIKVRVMSLRMKMAGENKIIGGY